MVLKWTPKYVSEEKLSLLFRKNNISVEKEREVERLEEKGNEEKGREGRMNTERGRCIGQHRRLPLPSIKLHYYKKETINAKTN